MTFGSDKKIFEAFEISKVGDKSRIYAPKIKGYSFLAESGNVFYEAEDAARHAARLIVEKIKNLEGSIRQLREERDFILSSFIESETTRQ